MKNINEWLFICIDQIKKLADFFGAVQTPTCPHCTAYRTLTSVKLQIDGERAVALWYRYLLNTSTVRLAYFDTFSTRVFTEVLHCMF